MVKIEPSDSDTVDALSLLRSKENVVEDNENSSESGSSIKPDLSDSTESSFNEFLALDTICRLSSEDSDDWGSNNTISISESIVSKSGSSKKLLKPLEPKVKRISLEGVQLQSMSVLQSIPEVLSKGNSLLTNSQKSKFSDYNNSSQSRSKPANNVENNELDEIMQAVREDHVCRVDDESSDRVYEQV